jgi:O-antigen/teichoic acid export membrane protein
MSLKENTLGWFRKGSTALADQVLFATSGLVVNILLARWFPLEEYGSYALAFSIYLFLSSFHNAMLLEPMSVLGPASYRNSLSAYLGSLVHLHFAVTVLPALVVGVSGAVFGLFSTRSSLPSALWGVCVGTPCMLFFWLWRRAAYLDLRPGLALRGAAVYTGLVVLLMFLFHGQGWLTPFTAFVVQAIAGIAASLVLMMSVRPRLRFPWSDDAMRTILKQHWEYGRWVVVTAFVFWLAGDAYYVIVASTASISDVGVLRATQNFVRPVSQFIVAMTLLLVPWASTRFADRENVTFRRGINRITVIFTAAAVAYLIGLAICGKWLTELAYGGKYTQFAYLLPLMTLPVLFTAAAEGPAIAVRAMQVPSEIFWAYTAAAVPTILFGVVLARRWGLIGAAVGLAISSLAYFATLSYRYRARLLEMLPILVESDSELPSEKVPVA